MRIVTLVVFSTTLSFLFLNCGGKKYLTPVSMIRPDSLQKINDDDIRKAFENKPQLVKPLIVAIYNVGSVKTNFADSLRQIDFVKSVYAISPVG